MRGIPRAVRAIIAVLMVVIALSVVISATSGDRAGLTLPEKILRSIFSPIGNFFWNIGRGPPISSEACSGSAASWMRTGASRRKSRP